MELPPRITLAETEAALRKANPRGAFAQVKVKGHLVKQLAIPGRRYWFEYHCWESHNSGDAEVWYRSHQQAMVLGFDGCDPPAFTTFKERAEAGHLLVYKVKFDDGLEWGVFEDELMDDPKHFCRPDPPKKPETI